MTMDKKFILVEPHVLENLQLTQTHAVQPVVKPNVDIMKPSLIANLHRQHESLDSCRNILNYESLLNDLGRQDESLASSGYNMCRNVQDNKTHCKHTCSYCGHMFAKGLNCRRHLAIIHGVDVNGKPIDNETLRRYKGYNQRQQQIGSINQCMSCETEDDEPYFSYIERRQQTKNNYQTSSESEDESYVVRRSRPSTTGRLRKLKMRSRCSPCQIKWINY